MSLYGGFMNFSEEFSKRGVGNEESLRNIELDLLGQQEWLWFGDGWWHHE